MMTKEKLGNLCDVLNGYAFKSSKYVKDGIRVIRITNVQKGIIEDSDPKYYPIDEKENLKNYLLCENDLLISLTGNVGRVGLLGRELLPSALNQRVGCLRIKDKNKISMRYLFQALNSNRFELECINSSKGIAQKNLSTEWLKEYEISIPSMEEQNTIAQKLENVQSIIDMRKKQLEDLNNLIKSQFVEMFITNRNDSWRLKKLKEVCIFNPKKLEISNVPDDFKVSFIPMTAVTENGEIDTSDIRDYKEVNRGFTYFRENDVLFAKITPCMENGKGAVAINLKNKIGFGSTEFHVVRPKETMNSRWIYTLFSLSFFRNEAEKNMTGSAGQKRVPIKFIENYEIFVPPIELQNKFASFVEHINKLEFAIVVKMDSPNG